MDRLLTAIVFAVIQFAAVAVAVLCYGPASRWMTGGGCLSPAVRVPLVVLGVGLAELLVIAALFGAGPVKGPASAQNAGGREDSAGRRIAIHFPIPLNRSAGLLIVFH